MHFAVVHVYFFSSGSQVIKGVKRSNMSHHKGQISNNVKLPNQWCHHVVLGQTCKSLHGDLFVRPTVTGSKVKKKRQRQGPCHRDDTAISSSFFFCQSRCNSVMTWPILTKLGGKDHWPCPNMSPDIDLHMTFDLDIRVKNVILL